VLDERYVPWPATIDGGKHIAGLRAMWPGHAKCWRNST
jgi:hypothetical protein